MKVRILGDVHGIFSLYNSDIQCEWPTLQLGDMGIGFPGDNNFAPGAKDFFINGNHDDPKKCLREWPDNFLKSPHMFLDMFCLGGGFSIDKEWRTPGVSWWEDEELSVTELEHAIEFYEAEKPSIVVTHEAPAFLGSHMYKHILPPSRTAKALEAMYAIHQPTKWYFGHHHCNFRKQIENTYFYCINKNEYIDIDTNVNLL